MIVAVGGTDNGIYWCQVTIDPIYVQGPWHKLTGATNDSPSLLLFPPPPIGSNLYVAVRGMDDGIYWCCVNLGTLTKSAWQRITGATIGGPAIAVTPLLTWLTIAVRGTDNRIYFQNVRMTDNYQPGWNALPGSTPSGPAMKYTAGVLFFCVRGMDNGIYWTLA